MTGEPTFTNPDLTVDPNMAVKGDRGPAEVVGFGAPSHEEELAIRQARIDDLLCEVSRLRLENSMQRMDIERLHEELEKAQAAAKQARQTPRPAGSAPLVLITITK